VATEAAWLNGNNCEKEEINEAEKEKKRKDERKVLTLTGLLMEGPIRGHFPVCPSSGSNSERSCQLCASFRYANLPVRI
jgi:hypothetical protein